MKSDPFVIERLYNAPLQRVWKALTDPMEMKEWYFDIKEFRPEVGFEFEFYGGAEDRKYLHKCKIIEVVPGKKLSYSWRYESFQGDSLVTFELFDEVGKTRLKLTHQGLESFPKDNKDFAGESFAAGWTYITGTSLKEYVEK
jgi:uncharacterized protein YndB with AHSA1/START domain